MTTGMCSETHKLSVRLFATIIAFFAFPGCEGKSEFDKVSSVQPNLRFQKPEDGKLTVKYITEYIAIRETIIKDVNAQKLARKALLQESNGRVANSDMLHYDEIERAAALSFSKSYDEYLWIKDKIISAQTKLLVQQYYDLNKRIITILDSTLTNYKETVAEEPDPNKQHKMDGYVDEMKNEIVQLRKVMFGADGRSEALTHNMQMVEKFKTELETMEQSVLSELGTGPE